ncbi:MAG: flagellar protein FlgN [Bdellovibrionales bacterium]
MKQDAYQSLIQILEELVSVYNVFFNTLEEEKTALISFDLGRITEINQTKEAFITKTKALEKIRQERVETFLSSLNLAGKTINLTQLVDILPKDQGAKLRGVQVALDITLTRVRDYNKQNERLTQNALKIIKHNLNSSPEQASNTTYKKQGTLETNQAPGKFVSKEI